MTVTKPKRVTRAQLRQNQSAVLNRVSKENRILVTSRQREHRKVYLVDQEYLDQLTREFDSLVETLDILMNEPLTSRLLKFKKQFRRKPASVKVVPFDEAFLKL